MEKILLIQLKKMGSSANSANSSCSEETPHDSRLSQIFFKKTRRWLNFIYNEKTQNDTKKFYGITTYSRSQCLFHEIFSCPFVHFVVQKKISVFSFADALPERLLADLPGADFEL